MVVAPTVLVVGNDEKRLLPSFAIVHGIVNIVDQLLTKSDVVIGMLAVASGGPVRLQKRVGRQGSTGGCGLEVFQEAEMRIVRIAGVGKSVACEGLRSIAIDGPTHIVVTKQAKNAGNGEGFSLVVHVALTGGCISERSVRHGLGRQGTIPVVAHGVATCEG